MYYVYILYSPSGDKYYVGQTNNLAKRVERHNSGYASYTSRYMPWELIGFIEKPTRSEAMALEAKLKNLNRVRLLSFIEKYIHNN